MTAPGSSTDIEAAFEALPSSVWSFTGPEHVVTAANFAARASMGHRADLIGRPVRELVSAAVGQEIFTLLDEVFASGLPRREPGRRVVVDTGGDEPTEGFFDYVVLPVADAAGRTVGLLSQVTDVTAMVVARREAQRQAAMSHHVQDAEHRIVQALQHSLLPAELPIRPEIRIAARYQAATDALGAGGDWFDVVAVSGGALLASVGDVVGNGAAAAAVMGQLRSALSAYATDGSDVAESLAKIDRFARSVPGAAGATVCLLHIDPAAGTLRYASAGHPCPLVRREDGTIDFLPTVPGPPLGVGATGGRWTCGDAELGRGDLLLLYSDGLLHSDGRPGHAPGPGPGDTAAGGRKALEAAVTAAVDATAAEDVESVLARLIRHVRAADDIALLALFRLAEPTGPLRLSVPANAAQLGPLRRTLQQWLLAAGVTEADSVPVQIAVSEAVSNAIEHAYPPERPGAVALDADIGRDGQLRLRIADTGRWRAPGTDGGYRGRGLALMRATMDTMTITRDAGTVIRVGRRLRRSLRDRGSDRNGSRANGRVALSASMRIERRQDVVAVHLAGQIDMTNAEHLATQIRTASRAGAVGLVVDLTGVRHLASAGVRLLFDLATDAEIGGSSLVVRVEPGSVAEHVLTLTDFGAHAAATVVTDP